jgi:hypothetical protein
MKCLERGELRRAQFYLSEALRSCRRTGDRAGQDECRAAMGRISLLRNEYPLDRDHLLWNLTKQIDNFRPEELDLWEREGYLDSMEIDGARRYYGQAVFNLAFNYPGLMSRYRGWEQKDYTFDRSVSRHMQKAREKIPEMNSEDRYFLDPVEMKVTASIKLNANLLLAPGHTVRIWAPFPLERETHSGIKLISSRPRHLHLTPPESEIGVIYFEVGSEEADREIEYTFSFKSCDTYYNLKPEKIEPIDRSDPRLARYLASEKHITVSDEMRELARTIAGDRTNPYLQAWSLYEWMTENIEFNLIPHGLIEDESTHVLATRKGDCGGQAIFLAALARSLGIPAKVSGGWQMGEGFRLNHLWTQLYLPPYGWVPVDVEEARCQMVSSGYEEKDKPEIRKFYFGFFDRHHICIHDSINLPLEPPRYTGRSFDYAFHLPEKEYRGQNLGFDTSSFDLSIRIL